MNDLVLCASCSRHTRRTEERCPFCGTLLSPEARRARPPVAPPGLSRAKLYAFHAAVATGVAASACGGSTISTTDGSVPVDAQATEDQAADAPSVPDANEAGTVDAPPDVSTPDAGPDEGVADAAPMFDRWGPPPPPYGCVFPEGCGDVKV
jgi:hypothetical protein